jgi:hypothetical protein
VIFMVIAIFGWNEDKCISVGRASVLREARETDSGQEKWITGSFGNGPAIRTDGPLSAGSQLREKLFAIWAVAMGMLVPLDHSSPEKSGSAETAPIDKEMPDVSELIDRPTLFEHVSSRQLHAGARFYQ